MRGTRNDTTSGGLLDGIIPAYAGNTGCWNVGRWHQGDHPRVCGEHTVVGDAVISAKGSSPRMRGTPHVQLDVELCRGIIPAYAGNTSANYPQRKRERDHPRVCGEHAVFNILFDSVSGSSPRMRGTLILLNRSE